MLEPKRALAFLGLVLSACLLLAFPLSSAGATTTDTWSGTWSRAEDGVNGNLILTQSGSTVSGHYTWNTGGTVSGSVSGATFSGAFDEAHYKGTFALTIAGTKFTGSYTGTNKDTGGDISGPFDGTCIAGDCLQNGAAPSPSPSPSPSGPGAAIGGLTGKVEVQLPDGAWQPATTSIVLQPGDKIHTGFKGGATLTFPDGSTLTVKPMTLIQVKSVGPDGQTTVLQLGEVKATVQRVSPGHLLYPFEVITPTTTASSRGTVYSVLYDGAATIVSVTTDSVLAAPVHGKAVIVPAGKEAVSTASTVSKPVAIGTAGAPLGSVGPEKAETLIRSAIATGLARCQSDAYSMSLKALSHGWLASVKIVGAHPGTGVWTISLKSVSPTNTLAKTIAAGCPPPPPAPVVTGHYTGTTAATQPIAFDVTTDRRAITNFAGGAPVTCSDQTTWTWTITFTTTVALTADRRFTQSYSGPISTSSSATNIVAAYTLAGQLDAVGGATGTFGITSISWDQGGAHHDCTGTAAAWTAHH